MYSLANVRAKGCRLGDFPLFEVILVGSVGVPTILLFPFFSSLRRTTSEGLAPHGVDGVYAGHSPGPPVLRGRRWRRRLRL